MLNRLCAVAALLVSTVAPCLHADGVQLGARPFDLVAGMDPGALEDKLASCRTGPFHRTDFSIAHRGASAEFPEHTREAYDHAARQGAGIVECDVTCTKDGHLVCRHSECDLRATTNIAETDLSGSCTSDLTLAQYRTLQGTMD